MLVPAAAIARTRSLAAFISVLRSRPSRSSRPMSPSRAPTRRRSSSRGSPSATSSTSRPSSSSRVALFAATRAITPWTLAVSAALTAWAIGAVPLSFPGLEGDAPGLAILSRIKEDYDLGRERHRPTPLCARRGSPFSSASRRRCSGGASGSRRGSSSERPLLSIGWSVRAEHVAAKASNDFSDLFFASLPKPLGWVDEATGDQPVRLHRPEDRGSERRLVDGVLEPERAQGLEPRRHRSRPGACSDPRHRDDRRPTGRRSRVSVCRRRQAASRSLARPCREGKPAARPDRIAPSACASRSRASSTTAGSAAEDLRTR